MPITIRTLRIRRMADGQVVKFRTLKRKAKEAGLSAREIASRSNGVVTHSAVASIFKGKTDPRVSTLKAICDVLGLPVEQALKEAA
jgi:transcriptional regulator with XRE-family HTH domain